MPFERFISLIGNDNFKKIQNLKVMIVGVGGVGGYTVESLARSGVGTLILVDYDTISLSNLNRQIIATKDTIGEVKVDAFKRRIESISSDIQVKAINQKFSSELLDEDIDFVVDACDDISAKKIIIEECLKRGIPFISSTGTGKRLDPTKLMITTLDKTSYDPLARILRKYVKDNKIRGKIPVLASSEVPIKTEGREIASCSFVPSTAGLLIASYVINSTLNKKE